MRLTHSGVKPETQIHTHMCYSEFTDIIPAIDDMDADVITFEASRSDLQILDSLKENHFKTEVGPGVYDIHSPRVPSVEEIVKALEIMLTKVDREKLWVNPDCGLKTRGDSETDASLRNMVEAFCFGCLQDRCITIKYKQRRDVMCQKKSNTVQSVLKQKQIVNVDRTDTLFYWISIW